MQERQLFLMDEFGRMEVCLPLMIILVRYGSMVILVWSDSLSWSSVVEAGLDLWSLYKETYDLFLDNQPSVWFVCLHSSNLVYNKSDLDPLVILQNWNIMCGWAGFAGFCNFNLLFKLNNWTLFKNKISAYIGNSVFLQISIWTNYNLQFETGWCAWFLQSKMSQAYA